MDLRNYEWYNAEYPNGDLNENPVAGKILFDGLAESSFEHLQAGGVSLICDRTTNITYSLLTCPRCGQDFAVDTRLYSTEDKDTLLSFLEKSLNHTHL